LNGFNRVFDVAFVINGQLFAGVNAVVWVSDDFQQDLCGLSVLAATFGQLGKLTARLWAEFGRQPNRQGL
jgi:hypothetical protein